MNAVSPTPAWAPGFPAQRPVPRHTLEAFLAVEFLCQLALLVPGLNVGPLRLLWRAGVFALSIALIAVLRGKRRASPAAVAAFWVMALMTVELFHPTGNSVASAVAQWAMYLAVLAPLFWMPRLEITPQMFRRVLLLFWGFYSLSALVGVLQVYDPGHFQPQLSPLVASMGDAIQGLKITLANGATIFRPMGLTDTPGGAATAGMWAVIFGLGLLLTLPRGRPWLLKRAALLGSMLIGAGCIYLSQVRVLMVVLAVWMAAFLGFLLWHRRWRQFLVLALMAAAVGGGAWVMAARVGGANMTTRAATVAGAQNARTAFLQERGAFVRQTFTSLLPTYPLGAGLGRWGMMNTYFGDNTNPDRGRIYVEIEWQGWVLDGGVPMLIAYLALLATAMLMLWRIARRRGPMAVWALLCLAYDVGVIAFSFDYTPFTGEAGMEFWFINALVLAAAAWYRRQLAAAATGWSGSWGGHWSGHG